MAEFPILPFKVDAVLADTMHMSAGATCACAGDVAPRSGEQLPSVPDSMRRSRIAGPENRERARAATDFAGRRDAVSEATHGTSREVKVLGGRAEPN
jgi:hypothetical protein